MLLCVMSWIPLKDAKKHRNLFFYYTWLMDCVSLIQFSSPLLGSIPGGICHLHSRLIHTHLSSTSLTTESLTSFRVLSFGSALAA